MANNKQNITYRLDAEVVEWINNEAQTNNMTPDEVVESLVFTIRALTELKDETMGAALTMLGNNNQNSGDLSSWLQELSPIW